jgi:hypothetical protein
MGESAVKYMFDRDMSRVKVLPGAKATRFFVGDIPHHIFWNYVMNTDEGSPLRAYRAFQYGVVRIADLAVGGSQVSMVPEGMQQAPISAAHWTEDQMAKIPPVYVAEIGGLAFARSFFGETSPQSWPPSQAAQSALMHRMMLRAELIREELAEINDGPSAAGPSPSDG